MKRYLTTRRLQKSQFRWQIKAESGFGLVSVFVIALQVLTSVAAFRDRCICRSPRLVRPSNDKINFTERPLDWRKASIHVALGQPMRRVYKKRVCSSLAFRIKDIPSLRV